MAKLPADPQATGSISNKGKRDPQLASLYPVSLAKTA